METPQHETHSPPVALLPRLRPDMAQEESEGRRRNKQLTREQQDRKNDRQRDLRALKKGTAVTPRPPKGQLSEAQLNARRKGAAALHRKAEERRKALGLPEPKQGKRKAATGLQAPSAEERKYTLAELKALPKDMVVKHTTRGVPMTAATMVKLKKTAATARKARQAKKTAPLEKKTKAKVVAKQLKKPIDPQKNGASPMKKPLSPGQIKARMKGTLASKRAARERRIGKNASHAGADTGSAEFMRGMDVMNLLDVMEPHVRALVLTIALQKYSPS